MATSKQISAVKGIILTNDQTAAEIADAVLSATPANSPASAWYRGVYQPSTPNGPEEYDVDMVWGEDAPDGDNWLPLYATPANSRADAIRECIAMAKQLCLDDEDYGRASEIEEALRALLQQEGE